MPLRCRARLIPTPGRDSGQLIRTLELSPYDLALLREDVRRAGPGARLEIEFLEPAEPQARGRVEALLAALEVRGLDVALRGRRGARARRRTAGG